MVEVLLGHSAFLSIAALNFRVSSRDLPLCRHDDPSYGAFRPPDDGGDAVPVAVTRGGEPILDKRKMIFSSDVSWELYADGKDRCIALRPPPLDGDILWTAKIDRVNQAIDVHAGRQMVRRLEGREAIGDPLAYPLDQLALMYLLGGEGAIVHAAGAVREGKGYLFPGRSGAGKSTVTRLLEADGGWRMLSDDRVVARRIGGRILLFGTPWPGDAGVAVNESAPLGGVFFLEHGKGNSVRDLPPRDAVARLLPAVSLPWYDREVLDGPLGFCEELLAASPAREFRFTPESAAVEELKRFL